jgi:hypothetical protein
MVAPAPLLPFVAQIAIITRHYGRDDPRLPELYRRLDEAKRVHQLRTWAERNAASLPAFVQDEVSEVAAIAARLDAKIRGGADAPP